MNPHRSPTAAEIERELATMIKESLARSGRALESVELETELRHLGLDSIDMVELAVGIKQRYGVNLAVDGGGRAVFRSVRTLATSVREGISGRTKSGP